MLADYTQPNRQGLKSPTHLAQAAKRRNEYFSRTNSEGAPLSHQWFDPLESLLSGVGVGWSYKTGTAVHLDIVACTTTKPWKAIPTPTRSHIIKNCAEHFLNTFKSLAPGTILLSNGVAPDEIPGIEIETIEMTLEPKNSPRLIIWKGVAYHWAHASPFFGWKVQAKDHTGKQMSALQTYLKAMSRRPRLARQLLEEILATKKKPESRTYYGYNKPSRPSGYYAHKPGTEVIVQHAISFPLPTGLLPSQKVTIQSFDRGSYAVTCDGKQFHIPQNNIVEQPPQP